MDVFQKGQTLKVTESVMPKDPRLLPVSINEIVNFVMLDPKAVGFVMCKNDKGQKGLVNVAKVKPVRLLEENSKMFFKDGVYHCKICVFKTIFRGACSGHLLKECSLMVGCDVCFRVFANKSILKRHLDRVFCKPVVARHECKNCLATFTNHTGLLSHMSRSSCNKMASRLRKVNPEMFTIPKKFDVFGHKCSLTDFIDVFPAPSLLYDVKPRLENFIKKSSVHNGQTFNFDTIVHALQQVLEPHLHKEKPGYNFIESSRKYLEHNLPKTWTRFLAMTRESAPNIKSNLNSMLSTFLMIVKACFEGNADAVVKVVVNAVCGFLQQRETTLIDFLVTRIFASNWWRAEISHRKTYLYLVRQPDSSARKKKRKKVVESCEEPAAKQNRQESAEASPVEPEPAEETKEDVESTTLRTTSPLMVDIDSSDQLTTIVQSSPSKKLSFECDVCNKLFRKRSDLKKHSVTHTKEKAFSCLTCGNLFTQRSTLLYHQRMVHATGDSTPMHVCYCGKGFNKASLLLRHAKTHSEERRFDCPSCATKFKEQASLIRHMKAYHQDVDDSELQAEDKNGM